MSAMSGLPLEHVAFDQEGPEEDRVFSRFSSVERLLARVQQLIPEVRLDARSTSATTTLLLPPNETHASSKTSVDGRVRLVALDVYLCEKGIRADSIASLRLHGCVAMATRTSDTRNELDDVSAQEMRVLDELKRLAALLEAKQGRGALLCARAIAQKRLTEREERLLTRLKAQRQQNQQQQKQQKQNKPQQKENQQKQSNRREPLRLPLSLPGCVPKTQDCLDRRILLCFDLDGTLLHRTSESETKTGFLARLSNASAYVRPHALDLLRALLIGTWAPHVQVAFYTSMTRLNAIPLCERLVKCAVNDRSGDSSGADPEDLKMPKEVDTAGALCASRPISRGHESYWVFSRDYNVRDPEGSKAWDTMRDLSRIWASSLNAARSAGLFSFGPHNTILIDNEPRKTRLFPRNALHVSSWTNDNVSCTELRDVITPLISSLMGKLATSTASEPLDVRLVKLDL